MNGGRIKLEAEGCQFATDAPSHAATSFKFSGGTNEAIRAYRDDVAERIGKAGLVDVRSPGEYSGELLAPENLPQEGAQRGGHIPTAKNIPWAKAVKEDGTFKDVGELKELYGAQGITEDRETIAYCLLGELPAHTWLVRHAPPGPSNVPN